MGLKHYTIFFGDSFLTQGFAPYFSKILGVVSLYSKRTKNL